MNLYQRWPMVCDICKYRDCRCGMEQWVSDDGTATADAEPAILKPEPRPDLTTCDRVGLFMCGAFVGLMAGVVLGAMVAGGK